MKVLPDWEDLLAREKRAPRGGAPGAIPALRVDVGRVAGETWHCSDAQKAHELLVILQRAAVSAIAVDSEFGFEREGFELRSGRPWNDVRAQRPICVSLAVWLAASPQDASGAVLRAVLDVRQDGVRDVLGEILRLRVPFVFHHAKSELFTFWKLGLDPDLFQLWDTYIAAACLFLGVGHKRSHLARRGATVGEEAESESALLAENEHRLSLLGQSEQYGVSHPFALAKDNLRARFLALQPGQALDEQLVEYAAADAEATLRVYAAQQADVFRAGLAAHLHTVEFPFTVANARIEWRGVHVDQEKLDLISQASRRAADHAAQLLADYGVDPPGSRPKFLKLMRAEGLIEHFHRDGRESVEDAVLEACEHLHPAIGALRTHRRYSRLAREEWLTGAMIGVDGRIHPNHRQLGAATGRNSCSAPNLTGIGRVLRPVVTAPPDRALVELDYSQIEVGVAAAEHDDPELIAAFNSGDVYAATAQRFHAAKLSERERALAPSEFKHDRADLREQTKTFVLAVTYNSQARAIATRHGITLDEAERERRRFLDHHPQLQRGLEESSAYGAVRGYATVVSGARRRVERRGRASSWEVNLLRNTPIQGSAAVVFKRAVIDLDREFRGTHTWIVLPLHDAVLIECDAAEIDDVSDRARRVMERALRSYYPKLRPRVEVNRSHPECWNKDGHADSLQRFLDDPSYRIEQGPPPGLAALGLPGADGERSASVQEAYEERAAIMQHDGGQTRPAAERAAAASVRDWYEEVHGA